jgi:hypothetical protein
VKQNGVTRDKLLELAVGQLLHLAAYSAVILSSEFIQVANMRTKLRKTKRSTVNK